MAKQQIVVLFLLCICLMGSAEAISVMLSGSQTIAPGDDWKQSVTLINEEQNRYLEGDFITDSGWCKWDNGKTIKHLKLEPRETRTEVLIIQIPSDVILDKNVCIITFEGEHKFKTEIYIIAITIVVVILVGLVLLIRKLKLGRKKNGDAWLEEALQ